MLLLKMRIIDVTAYTYDVNFQFGSYTMSGGRKANGYPSIVVHLLTDDGIEDGLRAHR